MSMPAHVLAGVTAGSASSNPGVESTTCSPPLHSPPLPPLSSPYCQVREVQHRIHELVGIPEQFGESLYVLQYAQGQVGRQGGRLSPAA